MNLVQITSYLYLLGNLASYSLLYDGVSFLCNFTC